MSHPESHTFKSELKQVLHLITHSLYSHQEIFLRELLSNASDAIDRIRFNSLENAALMEGNQDWQIRMSVDKDQRTLTLSDNGIGMTRQEVIENLGTIAKSGTRAFLERLAHAETGSRPELIGQFGVGFYSAFMVADKVTVTTRAAGETEAVRWESDGQESYQLEPAIRTARGTDVVLHLKEDKAEFLDAWRLRQIVKQFSDFIEHPIVMANDKGEDETLNSRKALWLRSKADITEEEHQAFYRQISGDYEEPAKVIHIQAEGNPSFRALLYLPKRKAFDLQFGEAKAGPKLYINRVLIQDPCEALLPTWLRFMKGVVDCPDLPLNVSRETLQQNPLLERIQRNLVRHVLKALEEMKQEASDVYAEFWKELGSILKEGLLREFDRKEAIADLVLFESLNTEPGKTTTLAAYVEAMPNEQEAIYYMTGEDRNALAASPVLETFKTLHWDVLLLTDPVDPFVFPGLDTLKEKPLKRADQHAPEAPKEQKDALETATKAFSALLDSFKAKLPAVKDVRLTSRLKESASCLVSEGPAPDPRMEQLLARLGQGTGATPRVLELNPDHAAVKAVFELHRKQPDDPRLDAYARLFHGQALLAEGSRLENPAAFTASLNTLLEKDART